MSETQPTPGALLSPLQARVVAVLLEKERTVPDTYPLSLNALQAGCNQKTSRDPVMSVSEAQLQEAIDALRPKLWVIESSGGRVMRYAHNMKRVLGVPSESTALLATLMLRGAQTAGELRINCERLQRFSDHSAMMGFLEELAARSQGALVRLLPRRPGEREPRWVHLLCGEPVGEPVGSEGFADAGLHAGSGAYAGSDAESGVFAGDVARGGGAGSPAQVRELSERVQALEAEVASLRESVRDLRRELGLID